MIDKLTARLGALGFFVDFLFERQKEDWVDCTLTLNYADVLNVASVVSVPEYLSARDIRRLADFITTQSQSDCEHRDTFVTLNLGFEVSIDDPDEWDAHIQVLLNVGMVDGNRVFSGSSGQIEIAELQKFSNTLRGIADQIEAD